MNTSYPQQVSLNQSSEDKSEIAFSNGFSYPSIDIDSEKRKRSELVPTDKDSFRDQYPHGRTADSNQHGRPLAPPRYKEYIDFGDRLKTYARWIQRRPDPTVLTSAGFFFTNQQDLVRCFQCGIGLKNFSYGDDPLKEHVRNSPTCPYLLEYLGKESLSAIKVKCQSEDKDSYRPQNRETVTNLQTPEECRHPEYSSRQSRISSFTGWPRHLIQKPSDLAEAGLYFTGTEDQVRCFTCDGGLRRWDPEDEPWLEHCRWFPTCPFVRKMKGDDYIALIHSSANNTNGENVRRTHNEQLETSSDISTELEKMTLRDPELHNALQEHKDSCLEMGFHLNDINAAVNELLSKGKVNPTIEELLDTIYSREAQQLKDIENERKLNESPSEENQRLKSFIMCIKCRRNNTNALFLPCTHHRFCMDCAEPIRQCPVCNKPIRQKIRTYLA